MVGAGALGLLAVAGARRLGGEEVGLEARHPYQKEAGERLGLGSIPTGCTTSWSRRPGPGEPARCGELVAPGGTIVVLGVHFGPVQLDWMPLFHRGAAHPLTGVLRPRWPPRDGGRGGDAADEPDIARTLITHRFPIGDATEAFRVASERASGAVRVVIEPS